MPIISKYGITGEADMVEAYGRALAAGLPRGVNSDYRDPQEQIYQFNKNYTPRYLISSRRDKRTWDRVPHWRRALYKNHVSVAIPGKSLHEKGLALDLPGTKGNTSTARGWMHRHGAKFGFIWPNWAQNPATYEEWHFEYESDKDQMKEEDDVFTDDDRNNVKNAEAQATLAAKRSDDALKRLQKVDPAVAALQKEVAAIKDDMLTASTLVPLTPMAKRIIEKATGEERDEQVFFGDTAAYAQALAFAEDNRKSVDGVDVGAIVDGIANALKPQIEQAVLDALGGTSGTITFDKE